MFKIGIISKKVLKFCHNNNNNNKTNFLKSKFLIIFLNMVCFWYTKKNWEKIKDYFLSFLVWHHEDS
jgi:hypothetical protein